MPNNEKIKDQSVGVSEFVKRQTKESMFTHLTAYNKDSSECTVADLWSILTGLVLFEMDKGNYDIGYRDGVILVHMTQEWAKSFYTYDAYPMFEGMKIDAKWAKTPGREHEPARLQVEILEPKIACKYVDIILYRKDVLLEDDGNVTEADWDIISINGRLKKDPPPIDPMTLVRNWLHLKGGTEMKGTTPEEMLTILCDSILYKNGLKKQMSTNKKG